VQPRLDGLVLLIQGEGRSRDPATGREVTSHNALGVVSFDMETGRFRFRHYTMDGRSGTDDIHALEGGGVVWMMEDEKRGGLVRFEIDIDGDTWHEVGQFSRDDGDSWVTFLEMTLTRQG
jgi:hypothetical protein